MSTLLRSDPLRELDRVLERTTEQYRKTSIPMDAYRHGEMFVIHFDLPGVDPDRCRSRTQRADTQRRAFVATNRG